MRFEKPLSQYNGNWIVYRENPNIKYFLIRYMGKIESAGDWFRAVHLSPSGDVVSRFYIEVSPGSMSVMEPTTDDTHRVIKASFEEPAASA
jgi:hypothetical protein